VYGESTRDYLVAIVVPSFDYLQQSGKLRQWRLEKASQAEIAHDPRLYQLLKESMASCAENAGLQGTFCPERTK